MFLWKVAVFWISCSWLWFPSPGNCTSWSQMSNSHHRRRDGKRPSEVALNFISVPAKVHDFYISLILIDWMFELLPCPVPSHSCPLSFSLCLFRRCSGLISSQPWSFTTHTSSIQRIITCSRTLGGRNGKRVFRFPWAPNPSPNL